MSPVGKATQPQATSQVIRALEAVWEQALSLHPELTPVRFALPSMGTRGRRLGHHLAAWDGAASEVAVYSNALRDEDAELILGVLLHEAAHALATARGVQDTAPTRRQYHNAAFANLAAETGLYLARDRPADVGPDTPAPATLVAYRAPLKKLRAALDEYRTAFVPNGVSEP